MKTLLQRGIQMDNRHTQKCSVSLIIKEMQIRATMSYNLTPVKVAIINKSTNNSVGAGVAKREPSCTVGLGCTLGQPLWKTTQRFLKKRKTELQHNPAIPLLGIYLKESETLIQRDVCIPVFTAALLTTAKICKQPKCPLRHMYK